MRFFLFLPLFIAGFTFSALADENKSLKAFHTKTSVRIDGKLDEESWKNAEVAGNFITIEPSEKMPSRYRTEVRIMYDDVAVYIGARMYDEKPDSILHSLSLRDDEDVNADRFYIDFDTFHDKQNAYSFGITSAGVQLDEKLNTDNFDAIWESAAKIDKEGWIAEIRIPYAAIRFPEKDIQNWGLQIKRHVRKTRETSVWNYIPNNISNQVAYYGSLEGIEYIKPPLRLFLIPYLGAGLSHYPYNISGMSNWSKSYHAGLDVKYGINESFTLDATLAPDFGQVQSDNLILNLSPFETEFKENRPFFTEGTELFNIDKLFYPRRIGQVSSTYYEIKSDTTIKLLTNPSQAQLINATKITGRSPGGLGIGFLNAITAPTFATYQLKNDSTQETKSILTNPLTNYNVIVANQTFKNSSYLSVMNTNVLREGAKNTANVSVADFQIGNKKGLYAIKGFGALSLKNINDSMNAGFKYAASLIKLKGDFRFEIGRKVTNDRYDPNDLGILFINNIVNNFVTIRINDYQPHGVQLRRFTSISIQHSTIYNTGKFQKVQITGNNTFVYKNYLAWFTDFQVLPVNANDFYESRVPGRIFISPAYYGATSGISSDYRKPVALDAYISFYRDFQLIEGKGRYADIALSPILRPSNKMKFVYDFKYSREDGKGFANLQSDSLIYFGIRLVQTYSNALTGQFIFNPKMSLSLKLRHYWSTVQIYKYKILAEDGTLSPDITGYNDNNNKSVNFFNIDFIYQWRFAPGSDLIFVWKNSIMPSGNEVPATAADLKTNYIDDLSRTIRSDQLNTFNIKILYYLDYQYLRRKNK